LKSNTTAGWSLFNHFSITSVSGRVGGQGDDDGMANSLDL
jgi:hypothetical protein